MNPFPAVDPIPLPAPVWLLKLLHIVTLALHFVAVEMLLGGLLLAVLLSLFRGSPLRMVTARALARRLTVVMTFVINLGVPPLLFAQVLYGRALYTSSVLIGVYWISIIGLLMLTYWLLYRFTARLEAGKSAWWVGLMAWLLAGCIARLLSTNMTLMLRPEVWRADVFGLGDGRVSAHRRPDADAALAADDGRRIVYRRSVAGVSGRAQHLHRGREEVCGGAGRQSGCRFRHCLSGGRVVGGERAAGGGEDWPCTATVRLLALRFCRLRRLRMAGAGGGGGAGGRAGGIWQDRVGWLGWAGVLACGAGRDHVHGLSRRRARLTLLSKGYDVWDRAVVTNWSVVGLFLVLFVAGLGVIGWLVSVVARAQKAMEGAA